MTHDTAESPEALLAATLDVSVPLHDAISRFDEPGARYRIAAACGVGFFRREGDEISHESSSPAPEIVPFLEELRERHLTQVRAGKGSDNSHLVPLLLLSMFMVDPGARRRFGLAGYATRPAVIEAITEDDGRHDPPLGDGDVALRAWVPLSADHDPAAGVHTAVLEITFPARGGEGRYVLW